MGSFESFAEILEKKIRREIEKDYHWIPAEPKSQPAFEPRPSELNLYLTPKHFESSQKAQAYHRLRPPPKPRPAHIFQTAQAQSFSFFKTHGSELNNNFSKAELRSAFRKLALRLHPDQGGQAEQFLQLKAAYERLQTVFG